MDSGGSHFNQVQHAWSNTGGGGQASEGGQPSAGEQASGGGLPNCGAQGHGEGRANTGGQSYFGSQLNPIERAWSKLTRELEYLFKE